MGDPATPDLRRAVLAVELERDVVVVDGPDAVTFLQGQLSQDVAALTLDRSAPSLLLQPTGKVDAWLRVTRTGEEQLVLDVDTGSGEAVLARLRRFLLRTKATLELATWSGVALRGPGSTEVHVSGGRRLDVAWPGVEGLDLLSADDVAVVPEGNVLPASALEAVRIESGVPAMGAEITEDTIPAELGQWLIDASASFSKGCYTGQELVARIDSRGGKVPRPVRGLLVDGPVPAPGAPVLLAGAEVGRVTSSARSDRRGSIALAIVGRAVEPGTRVVVGEGTPATVSELPLQ